MEEEAKILYEEPKETEESKALNRTSTDWKFPETKREALDLQDIGARMSLTETMQFNIEQFLQDVGADNEIPTGRKEKFYFLNNWHKKVAVNNPLWPEDLPFGYVYAAFVNAIIYNRVERQGNNIQAFVKAFRTWITQGGVRDRLYQQYYKDNPDKAPKQIEKSAEKKYVNEDKLLNQSPEDVLKQVNTLAKLHGTFEDAISEVADNGKTYREKLQRTFEHYKSKGHYE